MRWMVWEGIEIEGSQQGERRLFVHELHGSVTAAELVRLATSKQCRSVYFCAEHVDMHGLDMIEQMPTSDQLQSIVCLWPEHMERWFSKLHSSVRTIMELRMPLTDEVKIVCGNFKTRVVDTADMPASIPRDYDVDSALLLHEDLGQRRDLV